MKLFEKKLNKKLNKKSKNIEEKSKERRPPILLMGPYDIDKYHNLVAIIDEMTAVKLQDILVNSMEDGMKYVELKTTLP